MVDSGHVRSHLTDVVVDSVSVSLIHRVTHRLKHTVFVRVDLSHRDVHAVGAVVRILCPIRWYRLQRRHGNTSAESEHVLYATLT